MLTVREAKQRCNAYGFELVVLRRGEYRVHNKYLTDYYTDDLDDAVQYCWKNKNHG